MAHASSRQNHHGDNRITASHRTLASRLTAAITAGVARAVVPALALAQQTIKLTIASSHPTTLPWVGLMSTLFVPKVNANEMNDKLPALKNRIGRRTTPSIGFGPAPTEGAEDYDLINAGKLLVYRAQKASNPTSKRFATSR